MISVVMSCVASVISTGTAENSGPRNGTKFNSPASTPSKIALGTPSASSRPPISVPTTTMVTICVTSQPRNVWPVPSMARRASSRAEAGTMRNSPSR